MIGAADRLHPEEISAGLAVQASFRDADDGLTLVVFEPEGE
jgi:hypothetical protein